MYGQVVKWLFHTGSRRERRRAQRVPVHLSVQVKQKHSTMNGVMVNISRYGAAVELMTPERLRGTVELQVPLRNDEFVFFTGRIVHSHPTEMQGWIRYGIAFSGDETQNREKVSRILDYYHAICSAASNP